IAAPQSAAAAHLRRNFEFPAEVLLLFRLLQPISEESGSRFAESMALSRGRALPLHMRGRPGPLLFAAARSSGHPASLLRPRRPRTRIESRQVLRAILLHLLRASSGGPGRFTREPARVAVTLLPVAGRTKRALQSAWPGQALDLVLPPFKTAWQAARLSKRGIADFRSEVTIDTAGKLLQRRRREGY